MSKRKDGTGGNAVGGENAAYQNASAKAKAEREDCDRLVFVCLGTRGDVQPILALAMSFARLHPKSEVVFASHHELRRSLEEYFQPPTDRSNSPNRPSCCVSGTCTRTHTHIGNPLPSTPAVSRAAQNGTNSARDAEDVPVVRDAKMRCSGCEEGDDVSGYEEGDDVSLANFTWRSIHSPCFRRSPVAADLIGLRECESATECLHTAAPEHPSPALPDSPVYVSDRPGCGVLLSGVLTY